MVHERRYKTSVQTLAVLVALINVSLVRGQENCQGGTGWVRCDYGTNLRYILTENTEWMKALPDELLISQLSIPGTHETMATDTRDRSLLLFEESQTNSMALETQLNAGIRLIDVRARISPLAEVEIWHACVFQFAGFVDVLRACNTFLMAHPSETIVMRVQQTSCLGSSKTGNFYEYINRDLQRFPNILWKPGNYSKIPSLGEVRGKILILQDFESTQDGRIGLDYLGMTPALFDLNGEDFFSYGCDGIDRKWDLSSEHIVAANISNGDKIFVTSLVGSGCPEPFKVTPINAALGDVFADKLSPLLYFCFNVEGLNSRLLRYLQGEHVRSCGMIMVDFPGAKLIEAIIALNDNLKSTNRSPRATCRDVTISAGSILWRRVQLTEVPTIRMAIQLQWCNRLPALID